MQWTDPNQQEPVSFERLVYINSLDGLHAGSKRVLAVLHDPLRLGLGNRSWYDLAHWLGERGIECELSGPYWTHWEATQHQSWITDQTMFKLAYEAEAHVRMFRVEDVVRFERALLRGFGRPARMGVAQRVTQQEQRQHMMASSST
jgi:hypothetical protein